MNKIKLTSTYKKLLGDTYTPVGIYLKIRDKFPNSILMESSDYHGDEHSFSYIACDPIAKFEVQNQEVKIQYPNEEKQFTIDKPTDVISELTKFSKSFETESFDFNFITEGIFGYSSYNSVRYFEDVTISDFRTPDRQIPEMIYQVYRFIIVFNHFNDELYIFEHRLDGQESELDKIETYINKKDFATYSFKCNDDETSNYTNEEYAKIVQKGKDHCQRGDVFQIVLSRRFRQSFEGDEFNVYRTLRSINPSPYLFFFDFGKFKIFGSSPEAQIVIKNRKATIHPIAGTFKRTGNDTEDSKMAQKLSDDPKETSEHVMLVDLARNDLSRHGTNIKVETFKEIQYFSHVIHLVSKVSGEMDEDVSPIQLFADTFPAGTLSGAPKHRAMTLIDGYENSSRGFYGGAIGYLGFDGELNQAIMIRTILSKGKYLNYQAGAGVVAKSVVENEVQEVHNKLMALKKAIEMANEV
jgi:anthranilate synthase component 1